MGAVYKGLCPFHPDQKTPSLVVDPEKQTWKCFGCQAWGDAIEWVQKTDGLEFPEAAERLSKGPVAAPSHKPPAERTTTYDITDHKGGLIAQHVRRDHPDGTKTFAWVREGMPSLNGMKPADLPLYGMPHLIAAAPGDPIIVCEGEKAAQSLLDRGILAMGTVCGAATTPDKKVLMPLLGAARVYLWPDNDPPGYGHMAGIARVLQDIGQVEIWLVRWPDAPKKGDAADFQGDINLLLESAERFPSVGGGDDSPITVTDDVAERRIPLMGGNTLRLIADNVRRERTGVHARVTLKLDDLLLGYDTFNLGRSEERLRLAKAATSQLPDGYQNVANADYVRARLDAFAMECWDAIVGSDGNPWSECDDATISKKTEFWARPFVLKEGGAILFASPGAGKSYIAMLMAISVDAGSNQLWPVQQGRVLWINLERPTQSVVRRLGMINRCLGLPTNRRLLMLHKRGYALADVLESARNIIKTHHVQCVFLDSISRAGTGDLTENLTANRTIEMLSHLCPSWFALAHAPRADDTHAYGSVHFDAGADLMLLLRRQVIEDDMGIQVTVTKSNDTARDHSGTYCLTFADDTLVSSRVAEFGEFPELTAGYRPTVEGDITDYLRDATQATAGDIAQAIGRPRTTVASALRRMDSVVQTQKDGRGQCWGLRSTHPDLGVQNAM